MFSEESIGYSKVHRVIDSRLITFIQQTAMQLGDPSLKRYPSFRFPGGLPVTVESRHVKTIRSSNYSFTAKADGFRVLVLFFIYYIEGEWRYMCATLQRDGSCHLISIDIPNEAASNGGSLFDAELVDTSSGWSSILLFDCYCYAGSNLRSLSLQRRFSRCESIASKIPQKETDSVRVAAKPYYKLTRQNLPNLQAFLLNKNHVLEYNTDGVIIVSQGRCDVVYGRHEGQFKLKPYHTIDLIVIADDDESNTYYMASYDEQDDSYIPKQQILLGETNTSVNDVIECSVQMENGIYTYTPIKVRHDKTHPNSEVVIERTLQTIEDNISPDLLMTS